MLFVVALFCASAWSV